jgi:hypothetical protein
MAVDDALRVRRREPLQQLASEPEDLRFGKRSTLQPIAQGLAFHELHHEGVDVALGHEVVEGGDACVLELRQRQRLLPEPPPRRLAPEEPAPEDLHRDIPFEPRVPRAEDLSHAAGAETFQNLVRA